MKELADITYLEELNGITEALFLLEERLNAGCTDLETVLRTLFLYWFMSKEPNYFTNDNGSRDWIKDFLALLEENEQRYTNDSDFNWVSGYLLANFNMNPGLQARGVTMLNRARELMPEDPLPYLAHSAENSVKLSVENLKKLDNWGMMGEYFKYIFGK